MVFDPFISLFIRTGFALMFVLTALHKVRDRRGFKEILIGYNIVPVKTIAVFAAILPVLEILVAGALMVVPFIGIAAAGAILGIYALIMAFNITRGNTQIDCGCSWGGDSAAFPTLSWAQVTRNIVLIATLAVALVPMNTRVFLTLDWINLVLGLGFIFTAVKAAFALKSVYGRMKEFGHA